jgi:hypothetical protein
VNPARSALVAALIVPTLVACGDGRGAATVGKIVGPPVPSLTIAELGALNAECLKYPPNQPTRGPYDGAYCDQVLAAYNARTWAQRPASAPPRPSSLPALR